MSMVSSPKAVNNDNGPAPQNNPRRRKAPEYFSEIKIAIFPYVKCKDAGPLPIASVFHDMISFFTARNGHSLPNG
jgi:hypothetical protein